jgi:chromosome segregation ATPase
VSLDQQFNTINDKLQQLVKQYQRLQKENELLKKELQECKKAETSTAQNIDELKEQVQILKLSSGEMDNKEKKEFEKKINQYIREIDKCIAYLNQ